MKLRLRGSSLRLRLGQAEVTTLVERGRVEERVSFGANALVYAITSDETAKEIVARLDGAHVEIVLPRARATAWATSDDVGLEATQPIAGEEPLRILVEKDFACLKPRSGEDDTDAFPNPSAC